MTKALLALMLMTAQFLGGTAASVYLCIGEDGTFGFHTDGSCCTEGSEYLTVVAGCCRDCEPAGHHHVGGMCGADSTALPAASDRSAEDGCGCSHIPVVVATEQPAGIFRASWLGECSLLFATWVPEFVPACLFARSLTMDRSVAAVTPNFRLVVVSTVVIRC